jgi:hypothetical protein
MKENQREREEDRRLPGCTLEALGNLTLKGMNRRIRRSEPDTPFSLTVCTHTHTHTHATCNLVQAFTGSAVLLRNRFNGPFQLFHNFANRKKKMGSVLKKKKQQIFYRDFLSL